MDYSIELLAVIIGLQYVWTYRLSSKLEKHRDSADTTEKDEVNEQFRDWSYKSLTALALSHKKALHVIALLEGRVKLLEPQYDVTSKDNK